jgi:hypothetical protein
MDGPLVSVARRVVFFRRFYSHVLSMMLMIISVIVGFIFMLTIFRFILWMGTGTRDNSLILNASKTQALLISQRIRSKDFSSVVILGGDSVRLFDVVKNLGLYVDGRLSWRKQVSYVVSRTFSTLRLLYRFQRYTFRDLRIYLVRSLIVHSVALVTQTQFYYNNF